MFAKSKWEFRAVQLDLARQMETLEYIKEFIDLISKYNYNKLVLYLEGRIKTETFPYPPASESYTPEEMKEIVEYASKKDIDVIPVISMLGHAELFLKYPEMQHLAELRNETEGVFGGNGLQVFCPSLPETFDFAEAYFREIAEIFPSEYIHIGSDESWDMGLCESCVKRLAEGETVGDIFAKYVNDIHKIVVGKLGKKAIIWDDMFECYPDALEKVPKDIIMCCWQYQAVVDKPKAHFINCKKTNLFKMYDQMGFEYLVGPAVRMSRNIETFTEYGAKYKPLGGLLTIWEKSLSFLYEKYPIIAFAGELWNADGNVCPEDLFNKCAAELMGLEDKAFIHAVKSLSDTATIKPYRRNPKDFLTGPLTESEYERNNYLANIRNILESGKEKVSGTGARILEDMLYYLDWEKTQFELRKTTTQLYNPENSSLDLSQREKLLAPALQMIQKLWDDKKSQWKRFRNGVDDSKIDKSYGDFIEDIKKLAEDSLNCKALLTVRFFLPDAYSAQRTSISIKTENNEWRELGKGTLKNYWMNDSYYYFSFPVYSEGAPEAVRLETKGYGGQGFAFLEVKTPGASYVPSAVIKTEGDVTEPENILVDDLRWCHTGVHDTRSQIENPALSQKLNLLEAALTKKEIERY